MPENDLGGHILPFSEELVRRKLYRLTCAFLASEKMLSLQDDSDFDPIASIRSDFEREECTNGLIDCAIYLRIISDRSVELYGVRSPSFDMPVGVLEQTVGGSTVSLTLREACNKIVHSVRLHLDESNIDRPDQSHLIPVVHVYGKQRGADWKATIDIAEYVKAGVRSMPG